LNFLTIVDSNHQKTDKLIFLLISISIAVYLVFRAMLVPMAHDEIATFYYFVQSGHVNPFLSNIDTNNHFLNSALTWISYHLFGPSPLALRLPNLLFIPIFFYFLYKTAQFLRSRIWRFIFFISLTFSLHFIEFLALSRGYGMSMAMLLGSIYYLLEGANQPKNKVFILSLICIFVAGIANLALINTYALMLLFISISLILSNLKNLRSAIIIILICGIVPFSIVLTQVLYIKMNAGLVAGSPDGFWATTVTTLFAYLFEVTNQAASTIALILFSVIAIASLLVFSKMRNFQLILKSRSFIFVYLLAFSIATIILQGILFKVNYPDDRIGLYLYPLSIGSLIFLLDQLFINPKWSLLPAIPFLIIPIHFMVKMNTTYSIWYKYDVIPERFYRTIMQDHKPGDIPPTIAGHGLRIFCWAYLDYLHGGVASQLFFTHFPDYNAEFQIVNLKMIPGWQKQYDTIDYDAVSERHLLKHKKQIEYNTLIARRLKCIELGNNEYRNIFETPADTLRNKSLKIDVNLSLYAANTPFNSRIVFDVSDKNHKTLRYEYIQFNWLRNKWKGALGNFTNTAIIYKVPAEAAELVIYIWNIDKTEFRISEGWIKINEIKE
jgi:hypothetical protein